MCGINADDSSLLCFKVAVRSLAESVGSNVLEQAPSMDQGSLETITEASVSAIASVLMVKFSL